MRAAISKAEIESTIAARFGDAFKHHEIIKRPEVIATGIPQIDSLAGGGLPRGAITEIFGPASSGRTSFTLATLAAATNHEEVCALVDMNNTLDPESAQRTNVKLERLLWIRCDNNLEHAFKATDLLLQGGGFGVVVLDLGDLAAKKAKRIIASWWYRFRRTLEATPTALVVLAEGSCVRSCALLALDFSAETYFWSSCDEFLETGNLELMGKTAKGARYRRNSPSVVKPQLILQPKTLTPSVSHASLLQALNFQVTCLRPLHLKEKEIRILAETAH
jgi:recombination protein RecA